MPKSSLEQYQEFQDYTNYIDTSDVMIDFYKNQSGTGLEKYYLMIQEWLNIEPQTQEDNKPLVIQADGGFGKKLLLVKWFEYHESIKANQKNNDLTILHFATTGGNNSNYFYAIYRILIKLREELNIGQKVELHEEKLRKYFSYWLDVCNQRIENQTINNVDNHFDKIILVFEGIDYFVDRTTGKEGNIAFWLPKYFPKNVKVIVTADRQSESMKYFNKLECPKVNIPYDINIMRSLIKWQNQKNLCVEGQIRKELFEILENNIRKVEVNSLYVKSFLSCLLPQKLDNIQLSQESVKKIQQNIEKIDRSVLKNLVNVEELFEYLLEFWSKVLFQNENKFQELIGLLISTQKGLTKPELISITKLDSEQLKVFITIFRDFLMNFKDLWMIKNDSFKRSIFKKYSFAQTQKNEKIAEVLKKTPNSVRKLEEQTFQLYSAGNYFKLKEVISDIENFLLLFNPYTKYDLCRYWQKLEERSFDPVIEYNKAIEGFEMHYHPSEDDLFRIITQISRFLREFSDFETYYTPEFRHPQIVGNLKELDDIGILGQFKNLNLCEDNQQMNNDIVYEETNQGQQNDPNEEENKLKKKLKDMYEKVDQGKHIKKSSTVAIENKELKTDKKKIVKETRIEQMNVDVKSNQIYFRNHFMKEIKPFLEKVSLEKQKQPVFEIDNDQDEEYQDSEEQKNSNNMVAKIKNMEKEKARPEQFKDIKILYARTVEQQFELSQKPPTNYYYKRWIWMQYPWVCMTMKCDYSEKLRKCFTSPTSYMSVSEERQFTIQALKIALEAKKKKQAILQKPEQSKIVKKSTIKNSNSKNTLNSSVYDKLSNRQNSFKGASKIEDNSIMSGVTKKPKRFEQLAFITNSFLSLHNLSKEMQDLKIQHPKSKQPNKEQSTTTLFITSEDKPGDYSSLLHSFNKKNGKKMLKGEDIIPNETKQGLLPRIKQNVNNEMMNELVSLEKNNSQIRKQIDSFLYKNKVLAKRLKELKIIQYNNNSQTKNEKKIDEKKKKIQEIEERIEKVKMQYAHSLLEHERLNVLIKICKTNKTLNEEAIPDLVLECNNFKKMIKIETESIQQLKKKTEQIKKLTKKFIDNYCQRVENETNLQRQIKHTMKNRQNFQEEVQKYDSMIVEELQEKRKQLNHMKYSSVHHNSQHNGSDRIPRKSHFPMEENDYEEIFNKLQQYIDIQEDEDYQKNPTYQRLLQALSKKREFQTVLEERKTQLEDLQRKLQDSKRQYDTLTKAKEEFDSNPSKSEVKDSEFDDENQIVYGDLNALDKELEEKKRILFKAKSMKLSCLGMINSLYSKVGLPEQQKLVITEDFLKKINELKEMPKVQSC